MAPCWSTSKFFAEHKDLQAVCLATSINGKCALISRRSISIIKTDNLSLVEYAIKRETKWDSTYAEFSTPQPNFIAIANSQAIQIFNTDDNTSTSLIHTLRGHTRSITDLNWSYSEKTVLASASYENFMHIWDLRDSRKPAYSMQSIVGTNQIKWSKLNDFNLATSHEGDVRIWDKRKTNTPVHYITAHLSKINGIDWSPFNASKFVTCSQDGNIKFWDISTLKNKADASLTTGLPVWKARFTPFGNGLMTALVPQLRRTGENNSLWMWNIDSLEQPFHSFAGHLDVVLDFGWNSKSSSDYELITWAKDNTLRLWKVDTQMLLENNQELNSTSATLSDNNDDYYSDVDSQTTKLSSLDLRRSSNPSSPISSRLELTRSEENEDSDIPDTNSSNVILNLNQEFSLVNQNIPNIIIQELNANKRMCIVSVKSSISCQLKILFPSNYPYNVIPQFIFFNENDNSSKQLTDSMKKELLNVLQYTATSQVQRNRSCLEKCLRQFIKTFERLTASNQQGLNQHKTTLLDLLPSHKYGSYLDASVPFPRTSGARFCSSEILVCFGRPPHLEQMNVPTEFTPRSLSALSAYLTSHVRAYNSNCRDNIPSISSFYIDSSRKGCGLRKNRAEKKSTNNNTINLCGPVVVISVAKLLPISRSLAEQYLLICKNDIISLCEMNAKIASTAGRRDLFQTWYLVRLSAEIYLKNLYSTDPFITSWSEHPFGRKMIQSMIEHYALKCNDIQTAAMIACAFSANNIKREGIYKNGTIYASNDNNLIKPQLYQGSSHVSPPTPDSIGDWGLINSREIKRARSCSWSEYCEANEYLSNKIDNSSTNNYKNNSYKFEKPGSCNGKESIFDPELVGQYDYYKKVYADILYRWKLIEKRAQLLKTLQQSTFENLINKFSETENSLVSFVTECYTDSCKTQNKLCKNFVCSSCNKISLTCIICRLPVKGATNHCVKCGHGGHTIHMQEWFQTNSQCPTGCGCQCIPL